MATGSKDHKCNKLELTLWWLFFSIRFGPTSSSVWWWYPTSWFSASGAMLCACFLLTEAVNKSMAMLCWLQCSKESQCLYSENSVMLSFWMTSNQKCSDDKIWQLPSNVFSYLPYKPVSWIKLCQGTDWLWAFLFVCVCEKLLCFKQPLYTIWV